MTSVVIVGVGLPQFNRDTEQLRAWFQRQHGTGFEYAYLYPGMNRVIQSVGRLIRSEADCGVAILVCRRFTQEQYAALFPPDWSNDPASTLISRDLQGELRAFWGRVEQSGSGESALQFTAQGYTDGELKPKEA